jgi:hypothetical protein
MCWLGLAGVALGVSFLSWSAFGATELVVVVAAALAYEAVQLAVLVVCRLRRLRP